VASIAEGDGRAVRGRWLLKVISDLLELPRGRKPAWVTTIIEDAMGRDTAAGRRYPCPCCDFLTLVEPPTGTFAICPVCRWEDDNVQFEQIDYEGGANKVSLREARENFRLYAVSDRRRRSRVRDPLPEERP
jgi:Cysteine-rich CPCC